jgi:hypothetical protein
MGFFSNLFGQSSQQTESSGIDINCYIAASCLKALGYSASDDSIQGSVVYLAASQNSAISYTEQYFYEEAIYYLLTSLEAEDSYGLISTLKAMVSKDPSLATNISHDEILKCIKQSCISIAKERAARLGASLSYSDAQISSLLDQRFMDYKSSHIASMEAEEPLNTTGFSVGLSPRDHPLKIYLGQVADNMLDSLGVHEEGGISRALLETALLSSYIGSLNAASSIANTQI